MNVELKYPEKVNLTPSSQIFVEGTDQTCDLCDEVTFVLQLVTQLIPHLYFMYKLILFMNKLTFTFNDLEMSSLG